MLHKATSHEIDFGESTEMTRPQKLSAFVIGLNRQFYADICYSRARPCAPRICIDVQGYFMAAYGFDVLPVALQTLQPVNTATSFYST